MGKSYQAASNQPTLTFINKPRDSIESIDWGQPGVNSKVAFNEILQNYIRNTNYGS